MYKRFSLIAFLLILNALTTLFGMQQLDFPQSIPHRFPNAFATAWMLQHVELRAHENQKVLFDSKSCHNDPHVHLIYNQLVEYDKCSKAIEPMALYTLSYMSCRGLGCKKNNNNALDYIIRAAQQVLDKTPNDIKEYCAILNLRSILQISKAKAFNDVNTLSNGFNGLCFSAMFENLEAAYNLGLIHYFGFGQTNVCYPLAYKYFSAVAKNCKEAAYFSAHMLYKGLGVKKNYNDALVLQASQQELLELSDVQYERGCIYLKGGFGVNCDYQKARNYFLRSAEQGNDKALIRLAYMSYKGLGVTRDLFDTCQLLEKAVLKKNTKALQQIKKIAQEKKYIPAMYVGAENGSPECVQLLKEESLKENSLAKVYYGLILFNGVQDVVDSKPLEGLQLIKQAAESGSSFAMYWYGYINFYGDEIIPKNKSEGLLWLEKASNCGSKKASEFLAKYYVYEGDSGDLPRDVNKAFDYFVKASTQN